MKTKLLEIPFIWNISQNIFGCNEEKRKLYRSVFNKPGVLLDFGCADGNTFLAFSDFKYCGIDINKKHIEYANKKYASFSNAKFVCSDILNSSLEINSFDYILFAGTGHHIHWELLYTILFRLIDLLRIGGHLYFFDTIKDPKRKSKILEWLINLDEGKYVRTKEEYSEFFKKTGNLRIGEEKEFLIKKHIIPLPTVYFVKLEKVL
jgi:SAM-dependent methyltransferase